METTTLSPGDRIKLYFQASDSLYTRSTQQALIEWRLEAHPEEFTLISIDAQQKSQLIFVVEIKRNVDRLFEEKRIINLILNYNPLGFYLIFKNATVEFASQKLFPSVIAIAFLVLLIWVILPK